MIEFNSIKRKQEENVVDFIKRFNNLYNGLLAEIKPPSAGKKVVFARAFELDFGFTLREKISPTLDQIQMDPLEIEANLTTTGQSKGKQQAWDKGKGKEEFLHD